MDSANGNDLLQNYTPEYLRSFLDQQERFFNELVIKKTSFLKNLEDQKNSRDENRSEILTAAFDNLTEYLQQKFSHKEQIITAYFNKLNRYLATNFQLPLDYKLEETLLNQTDQLIGSLEDRFSTLMDDFLGLYKLAMLPLPEEFKTKEEYVKFAADFSGAKPPDINSLEIKNYLNASTQLMVTSHKLVGNLRATLHYALDVAFIKMQDKNILLTGLVNSKMKYSEAFKFLSANMQGLENVTRNYITFYNKLAIWLKNQNKATQDSLIDKMHETLSTKKHIFKPLSLPNTSTTVPSSNVQTLPEVSKFLKNMEALGHRLSPLVGEATASCQKMFSHPETDILFVTHIDMNIRNLKSENVTIESEFERIKTEIGKLDAMSDTVKNILTRLINVHQT